MGVLPIKLGVTPRVEAFLQGVQAVVGGGDAKQALVPDTIPLEIVQTPCHNAGHKGLGPLPEHHFFNGYSKNAASSMHCRHWADEFVPLPRLSLRVGLERVRDRGGCHVSDFLQDGEFAGLQNKLGLVQLDSVVFKRDDAVGCAIARLGIKQAEVFQQDMPLLHACLARVLQAGLHQDPLFGHSIEKVDATKQQGQGKKNNVGPWWNFLVHQRYIDVDPRCFHMPRALNNQVLEKVTDALVSAFFQHQAFKDWDDFKEWIMVVNQHSVQLQSILDIQREEGVPINNLVKDVKLDRVWFELDLHRFSLGQAGL
mmetsp:Transcript_52397/g.131697  ORF Transcript_52397/g.131697 Transcript_52397/m.131697 type:complete len:312 (-) Transcript_52397:223-1158(-)